MSEDDDRVLAGAVIFCCSCSWYYYYWFCCLCFKSQIRLKGLKCQQFFALLLVFDTVQQQVISIKEPIVSSKRFKDARFVLQKEANTPETERQKDAIVR